MLMMTSSDHRSNCMEELYERINEILCQTKGISVYLQLFFEICAKGL